MKPSTTLLSCLLMGALGAAAQPKPIPPGYADFATLTNRLQGLAARSAGAAKLTSIGKSVGGKDIWLLTLGRGEAAQKPALALVAGVEGTHLAGTELALQLAEKLLSSRNDSVSQLLTTKTIYLFPLVNPDAQAQAFATLRYERSGNARDTDDDRDGRLNEDPFEDLNKDGLITQLRVEDPTGQYIASKEDARVLVKADPAKGEIGRYRLLSEGIDNDQDGQFNEDGAGGIALDKNFTFDYPFFRAGSGEMPVSEPENRALLDFLYKAPNVYAVLTLGPYNNLSDPPKFDRTRTTRRIITGLLEKDAAVGDQVGKLYAASRNRATEAPPMPATPGNFAQTAYYHYGRFSFATPGWWVPRSTTPPTASRGKDSTATAPGVAARPASQTAGSVGQPAGPAGGPASSSAGQDELMLLKWAAANNVADVFVPWTPIEHPDFPGQKVEVGGIVPFARLNPPVALLGPVADNHVTFLTGLAARMPTLLIANVRTERLTDGLTRVSAQIVNRGLLPTGSEMGDRVRFVPKFRVDLIPGSGQTVVSGRRRILRGPLAAGETMDVSFLVSGSGRVTLEAGNAMTGIQRTELTLN